VESSKRPPEHQAGRSTGRRGPVLLALAAVGVFLIGALSGGFHRLFDRLTSASPSVTTNLLAFLMTLAVVSVAVAVLRWNQAAHEQTLRAATERRFQALVEQVPAVTYTWDPTKGIGETPAIYLSPQIETMLGYPPEEWIENPRLWMDRIHPDDWERIQTSSNRSDRTGAPFLEEYRMYTKDGRLVWIRDESVTVETDDAGKPLVVQGVMYDITQQRRAQEGLRLAEERYRTLVENLPVVTYVSHTMEGGDETFRYVAPGFAALTGYQPSECVDDPGFWEILIHPADRQRVSDSSRKSVRTGEKLEIEYRIVRKNGTVAWVRDVAVVAERDAEGIVWQGVFEDVTRRRHAELLLRDAEERFRTLVEQLPAVTYIEDGATDEILYISPQIEAMLGYTTGEWKENPRLWEERVHPADRQWVLAQSSSQTEDTWSADYRALTRSGGVVWLHNEAVLIRDEQGRPKLWQGVMTDITERKEAEERLRQAEERYRTLVERLPIAVYMDAPDDPSTAVYVSPQYERITGYTAEERMNDPELWVRTLHPDDRDRVVAESLRTNETGDPFDIEYRIVTVDGGVVWVHDHASLVSGPDGRRVWQGMISDVTERTLAQEALGRRDRILEAAGYAAERFLKARTWTECIDDVLRRLGESGDASRALVYENSLKPDGELVTSRRHGWADPEIVVTPRIEDEQEFPYRAGGFARWEETLAAGGAIHGPVRSYPHSERALLERSSILSCIAIPVFVGDQWWGYIGFDHCVEERQWLQAEIDALRVAANTLGAAIGRERSAQRLAETQARYRTLIEQIPAVTYMTPADGGTNGGTNLYVSPQVEAMFGYSPEEWNHDLWRSLLHEDDAERVQELDRVANETGEPFGVEYRIRRRDGSLLWVRDEAILLRTDRGDPMYWQGVRFDITAQKEAEEQLRSAEERYRSLIETIPAATYIDTVDAVSRAVYMSPQVEQIFGYTPQQWIADPELWQRGVHPDDLPAALERIERLNVDGVPYEAEYRFRRPDGRTVWVLDQAVTIRDELGAPSFSQGVMYDITERKETEEHLRDAEERFRAIVEHVPWAVYLDVPGPSMQTQYVGPQIELVTGIPPDEWMHGPDRWLESVHPDDRGGLMESYLVAVEAGLPWSSEYRILHRDGRTVWVHDETTFLHDEAGRPSLIQGVIADITERKLAEEALRDSEQREREAAERLRALDEMKNTFLAAVSHELRSPLTSILGLALTLERAQEMNEDDRDDLLTRLASNARKLDRLLKDLLDIDRLNRGIVEPQYRVTDVGALARRTVENLEALADRAVIVQVEPVVLGVDPAKVERIVENLLMNAARHTTLDRRIWLRVESHDGGVLIAVEDDGFGVPEGLRSAIFEPFRQGPSMSSHSPGTGIGLSLVGRFAALHGGRAWVVDRDGGGASFRVFLPAGPADLDGNGGTRPELSAVETG
jgi:PAS domain S-box-containing protein